MNVMTQYECRCSRCGGSGHETVNEGTIIECRQCWGAGTVLTNEGKLLIEFLRRHIGHWVNADSE